MTNYDLKTDNHKNKTAHSLSFDKNLLGFSVENK